MKKVSIGVLTVLILILASYVLINYWPYLFAKTVDGKVIKVEKLMDPITMITRDAEPSSKIFSFAVAIKDESTNEIFTASSEDRQWAAAQGEGLCAEAKFFPHPPWKFDKAGTYYGARLLRLWSCADKKPQ
jgi:hypothetical protein